MEHLPVRSHVVTVSQIAVSSVGHGCPSAMRVGQRPWLEHDPKMHTWPLPPHVPPGKTDGATHVAETGSHAKPGLHGEPGMPPA
jgi:hypothetical protein